jgi:hypothetical protein
LGKRACGGSLAKLSETATLVQLNQRLFGKQSRLNWINPANGRSKKRLGFTFL